ncbi:MAG: RHS repeat-associated core domain-containing protein [Thermoflexales bacterium]|nr:RHS repeat-associated core domain-containing protein [Thermoflexales bacterium]
MEGEIFLTSCRHTGQCWEPSRGLYDYKARFYDPVLGRFLQPDPIVPEPGNPQALNRYGYVYNNPLRLIDRTGHFSEEAILNYLKQTYGENWERKLAEWQANTTWWRTLREARPGDILIICEEGQQRYGRITGVLGEKPEQDILLGLERIQNIGRAFEEDKTLSGSQDIDLWSEKEILGLARYGRQHLSLQYWSPISEKWSDSYLNLPLIYRPQFGQTVHPVGKGLILSFMAIGIAEAYALGGEALSAGPEAIPATVALWVGATYLLLNWYNIALTPTGY